MAELSTTYLGIPLRSPIVVGASSISNRIDRIQKVQDYGAGALVIRSLFEEQALHEDNAWPQSSLSQDPLDPHSVRNHLSWTTKTRQQVTMPLIASLNAIHPKAWMWYAKALESTGIDALEMNMYHVETDLQKSSAAIEAEMLDNVQAVVEAVSIPVAVKLSPFFTSVAYISAQLQARGAQSIVLFNRFLQPDINLDTMSLHNEMHLSHNSELRLPLRWTALLSGRLQMGIALSTGVHTGDDVIKALLAGAQVVQVTSTLLTHGIHYLDTLHDELRYWLDSNHYPSVDAIRGKMNQHNVSDPQAFERAQYVNLLMDQR